VGSRVFRAVSVSNITISGCQIDGNFGSVASDGFFGFFSAVTNAVFEDNIVTNAAGSFTITGTSQFNSFRYNSYSNSHGNAFVFDGSSVTLNEAIFNKFSNNNGWGVSFVNGAYNNLAQGNRSDYGYG